MREVAELYHRAMVRYKLRRYHPESVPPLSKGEMKLLAEYRRSRRHWLKIPESDLLKQIRSCDSSPYYRAYVTNLIYWDLLDKRKLNRKEDWWKLMQPWDYSRSDCTNWDRMFDGLCKAGMHPLRALIITRNQGRK